MGREGRNRNNRFTVTINRRKAMFDKAVGIAPVAITVDSQEEIEDIMSSLSAGEVPEKVMDAIKQIAPDSADLISMDDYVASREGADGGDTPAEDMPEEVANEIIKNVVREVSSSRMWELERENKRLKKRIKKAAGALADA